MMNEIRADQDLIESLRAGEETAFMELVECYLPTMQRVALMFVSSPGIADEVIQETWIAVLRGLNGFEARSSLKTWIFSILTNRARTCAQREGKYITFDIEVIDEPAVEPERFRPPGAPYEGHWWTLPTGWDDLPEQRLLSGETQAVIQRAIGALPRGQREVMVLRDVEVWSSEEVCNVLEISEANQRVLLHRARSKVRQALEMYLHE
jgi:RNA polymerase sigma-70 factor (ECF subfamily)